MDNQIQNVKPQSFVRPEDAGVSTLNNAAEYLAQEIGTIVGKDALKEVGKKGKDAAGVAQGNALAIQQPEEGATEPSNINPMVFALVASALTYSTTQKTMEGQSDVLDAQDAAYSEKCKEQIQDIQNSIDQANSASKAGNLANIFGWVATIAIDVVAVAAVVVTGGAALPLLVGAMIATTLKVGSEFGSPVLTAATNALASGLEALGVSDDTAQLIASVAVQLTVLVGTIVACGVTALAKDAIVTLGEKAIKKVTKAAVKLSWNLLETASESTAKLAQGAMTGGKVLAAGAGVAQGGSEVVGSGYDFAATKSEIAAKGKQAVLDALMKLMNMEMDNISKIMAIASALVSGIADNIASESDTVSVVSRNI